MNVKGAKLAVMEKPHIYFANMGHGEAIAFEINGQWYLRDFGEYTKRENIHTACHVETILSGGCSRCIFTQFKNATGENRWNAILSHAHRDHFSGFKSLYNQNQKNGITKKVFKKAYLPNLYQNKASLHELADEIKSCVIIRTFSKNSLERENAGNFLIYHSVMAALADEIVFADSNTSIGGASPNFFAPLAKQDYIEHNKNDNDLKIALEYFFTKNKISDTLKSQIDEVTNNILGIIQKYYADKSIPPEKAADDYKQILNALDSITRGKNISLFTLPFWSNQDIDDNSLIFSIGESEKWLFLGDTSDSALEKILTVNKFKSQYYGIKAGHHGTRGGDTLRKFHINCEKSIICTGKGHYALTSPQASYKEISKQCIAFDYPIRATSGDMKNIQIYQCCNINNQTGDKQNG